MGTNGRAALWTILLLFVVLDICGIVAATTGIWFPSGLPALSYRSIHLEPNGLILVRDHDQGALTGWERPFSPSVERHVADGRDAPRDRRLLDRRDPRAGVGHLRPCVGFLTAGPFIV